MDAASEALLRKYTEDVFKAPASLGLTAAKTVEAFWQRHVLDAVKLLDCVPSVLRKRPLRVIDIGSGNGIPGIPLAILNPSWHITMIDSDNKKCGFLDMILNKRVIKNTLIICDRSEKMAHEAGYRESFELAFARALSKLPTAMELGFPFLKVSGLLIVPHGTSFQQELTSSENALNELGGALKASIPYEVVPGLVFNALLFEKIRPTPPMYPRRTGVPSKKPL